MAVSRSYLTRMFGSIPRTGMGLFAIAAALVPASGNGQALDSDSAACTDPQAAALRVHVSGFKNGIGIVRVQAYGPNPADFLQKGKWVRRVEVPLNGRSSLDVCLRLPARGRYAVAVRHDANASGKSDWNDGAGFSRNPRLSLANLKPSFEKVSVTAGRGATRVPIVMNYRHGLSIRPRTTRAVAN